MKRQMTIFLPAVTCLHTCRGDSTLTYLFTHLQGGLHTYLLVYTPVGGLHTYLLVYTPVGVTPHLLTCLHTCRGDSTLTYLFTHLQGGLHTYLLFMLLRQRVWGHIDLPLSIRSSICPSGYRYMFWSYSFNILYAVYTHNGGVHVHRILMVRWGHHLCLTDTLHF